MNEVAATTQEPVLAVRKISGDLAHPVPVWRGSDSSDLDPTRLQIDHEILRRKCPRADQSDVKPLPPNGGRRNYQRYPVHLPCEVHFGRKQTGIVSDISRTGLFIHTTARPEAGTNVTVVFPAVGEHRKVRVVGVVTRIVDIVPSLESGDSAPSMGGIGLDVPVDALGPVIGELLRRARRVAP